MQRTLICALVLASCGWGDAPNPVPDEPHTSSPGDDSGTPPTLPLDTALPGTIEADCSVDPENTLRYDCHVTVDPPGPVHMTLQKAAGGPIRTFTSDEVKAEHALTLWLMAPDTQYRWEAIADDLDELATDGLFTTKTAPEGAQITFTIEGTASFPYFLAASPCSDGAYAVIASTGGEVLWYQAFATEFFSFVDSLSFTEDGTILAIVDAEVLEYDLLGNELMRLSRFVDFDQMVHHDVFRKDGYTWVLHKDEVLHLGQEYTLDGFYVFDPAGVLVADWKLYDHFQPAGPSGGFFAYDYSHANSLWVDDEGDVFLSLRHLSAIAHIEGDLASPDFGTILWRMTGDPQEPEFGSDFTLTSADPGVSASFGQQHNVHLLPDGTMTMFDNRVDLAEVSRLLHLSYDLATGAAVVEAEYPLPLHCDFQGGAWHTAGGNPVATCAPAHQAFEFDLGVTDTPRWSADMACVGGAGAYVPRFIPLEESDL